MLIERESHGTYDQDLLRIRSFYESYYRQIEEGDILDWPEFFTENGYYSVQSASDRQANYLICDVFCDSRAMIIDRAAAINSTSLFEKHRFRHYLGTLTIMSREAEKFVVETTYLAVEAVADEPPAIFSFGKTFDQLALLDNELRFERREVVYDHSSIRNSLIFPL